MAKTTKNSKPKDTRAKDTRAKDTCADTSTTESAIVEALKSVYDPEIPVDIYELGLIYNIAIKKTDVTIQMTLTAPACPVAGEMPLWVEEAVKQVKGVKNVNVEMVFDPPWDQSLMSDEARLSVGMF